MKYIPLIIIALMMSSCTMFDKSEEAVVIKIDTASLLKGRTFHADVDFNCDKTAEAIHQRR